jgi:hypothetical protein
MECQLKRMLETSEKPSVFFYLGQRARKVKVTILRRARYSLKWIARNNRGAAGNNNVSSLRAGDLVRIRSKKEIEKTLDGCGELKGCGFMEEMWKYCDTKQRVLKPVKRFLDERDYLMKKCNGIVILENLICEGTKAFGSCDRHCHYFWREEWLEKVG